VAGLKTCHCDVCGKDGPHDRLSLWLDGNNTATVTFGNLHGSPYDFCTECLHDRAAELRKALDKYMSDPAIGFALKKGE